MHHPAGIAARALLALIVIAAALAAPHQARPAVAAGSTTTFFLLTTDNRIAALTGALPSLPSAPVAVTGLTAGDTLQAIAVRPQNGQLYGLGVNGGAGTAQLYAIAPIAGVATPIGAAGSFVDAGGAPIAIQAGQIGMDFNPAADRLRVVADSGLNFRINPNTGAFVDGDLGGAAGSVAGLNPDGPIGGLPNGSTGVGGAAYTNSAPNASVTTLYTIDAVSDQLFIQNPPNAGTQTGGLAITLGGAPLAISAVAGFDIPPGVNAASSNAAASGAAFALLTAGGATKLYQIELATGAATDLGAPGGLASRGLAVWAPLPIGATLSADGASLARFRLDAPGSLNTVAITGVVAGEALVGIDARPATGQLYGLGINAAANIGTLYRIDPQTGAATAIGSPGTIAFVDSGGSPIDLPDPAAVGYGVDFNPVTDRVRVVTGGGLNFRANPTTGAPVDGDLAAGVNPDGPIGGLPNGSTGVDATAYTNAYAGASATTMYTLDSASNQILIQNPPNSGSQTSGTVITLNGAPLDFSAANGFDIPPGASAAASNEPASGNGYMVLTVGGTTGLYQINLSTGAALALGSIGSGASGARGFVAWSEAPAAQLTREFAATSEAAGSVLLIVTSSGGAPLIASYTTGNGSASPGSDYTAISGTLLLGGDASSQKLFLPIIDDALREPSETIEVQLLGGPGATQAQTLTIEDNDSFFTYLPLARR